MHELGLTQEIVAIVEERVRGAKVRRLVLEIGKLSAILPDAIRFCFDVCTENTALEGATLEIIELPGRAVCRSCSAELLLDRPFGRCACGNSELDWLSGEEFRITQLEMA